MYRSWTCVEFPRKKKLLQDLKSVETPITSTDQGEHQALTNLRNKTIVNTFS